MKELLRRPMPMLHAVERRNDIEIPLDVMDSLRDDIARNDLDTQASVNVEDRFPGSLIDRIVEVVDEYRALQPIRGAAGREQSDPAAEVAQLQFAYGSGVRRSQRDADVERNSGNIANLFIHQRCRVSPCDISQLVE